MEVTVKSAGTVNSKFLIAGCLQIIYQDVTVYNILEKLHLKVYYVYYTIYYIIILFIIILIKFTMILIVFCLII